MWECKFCHLTFEDSRKYRGHLGGFHYLEKRKKVIKIEYIKICPKCNKEFIVLRLLKEGIIAPLHDEKVFCSRSCANSHKQSEEQNLSRRKKLLGKRKYSSIKEEKFCKSCNFLLGKNNKLGYCRKCLPLSKEYKEIVSKAVKGKAGGYRKGSGIGKKGWYKGFYCYSSWELAYLIFCLDHAINIRQNKIGYKYNFKGVNHLYYPDFILEDDTFVEIKGYLTEQDKAKIEQFKEGKLLVLYKEEMKKYIDYTINKYGTNYISLYEENSKGKDHEKNY